MKHVILSIVLLAVTTIFLVFTMSSFAGNINPANDGHQYAHGENIGWINLAPSAGPGGTVGDGKLSGYIWSENIGWINLNPAFGGVIHDGKGNLSGYAWSENAGWINFSCTTDNSCSMVKYGVTIDTTTGVFSGKGWGENIGWVEFKYIGFPNAENTYTKTLWRINGDISSNGVVTLEDAIMTLQINTGKTPVNKVHSGATVKENNQIGLEEGIYIIQHVSGTITE
ncbi:MAG: hypothetical protein ABIJ31_08085 [Pseudomonadota bacterium]